MGQESSPNSTDKIKAKPLILGSPDAILGEVYLVDDRYIIASQQKKDLPVTAAPHKEE